MLILYEYMSCYHLLLLFCHKLFNKNIFYGSLNISICKYYKQIYLNIIIYITTNYFNYYVQKQLNLKQKHMYSFKRYYIKYNLSKNKLIEVVIIL